MAELEEKLCQGVVDTDMVPLLKLINSFDGCYTLSSCSGRVGLIELPELGDKKRAVFHGKWHQPPSFEMVAEAVQSYRRSGRSESYLYLLTQCPILHMNIDTRERAKELFALARNCGFKHSAFKSVAPPFLLEVLSTERVDIPLGRDGVVLAGEEELRFFVERCNVALTRGKKKLEKLQKELESLKERTVQNDRKK